MWTHREAPQLIFTGEAISVQSYKGKERYEREMTEEVAIEFLKENDVGNYHRICIIEKGHRLEVGEPRKWIERLKEF